MPNRFKYFRDGLTIDCSSSASTGRLRRRKLRFSIFFKLWMTLTFQKTKYFMVVALHTTFTNHHHFCFADHFSHHHLIWPAYHPEYTTVRSSYHLLFYYQLFPVTNRLSVENHLYVAFAGRFHKCSWRFYLWFIGRLFEEEQLINQSTLVPQPQFCNGEFVLQHVFPIWIRQPAYSHYFADHPVFYARKEFDKFSGRNTSIGLRVQKKWQQYSQFHVAVWLSTHSATGSDALLFK